MRSVGLSGVLVVASLPACVLSPFNDGAHTGVSDAVSIRGYSMTAGDAVAVYAAPTPSGPFERVGTAISDTTAVTLDGVRFYEFQVDLTVDREHWGGDACVGRETYLRAYSVAGYYLPTFDAVTPNGKQPHVCVADELTAGVSVLNAILACDSPDSPNLRLAIAGQGVPFDHVGDVQIQTASDVAQWTCLRNLTGNLTIPDSSLPGFALPRLASVSGNLDVTYTRPGQSYSEPAREIPMDTLRSVGGDVVLRSPAPTPSQIIQVRVGMPQLASIGGDLAIDIDTFNVTLRGLPAVTRLNGDLSLVTGNGDTTLWAFLENLAEVRGDVLVDIGHTAPGVLMELVRVDGDFAHVDGNFVVSASAGSGYEKLASVGGDFYVGHVQPNGSNDIAMFPALGRVGSDLTVEGVSSGTTIRLGTAGFTAGGLDVLHNPGLTGVGLSNLQVQGSGRIRFLDNHNLCRSSVQAFLAGQTGWTGQAQIDGIDDGC